MDYHRSLICSRHLLESDLMLLLVMNFTICYCVKKSCEMINLNLNAQMWNIIFKARLLKHPLLHTLFLQDPMITTTGAGLEEEVDHSTIYITLTTITIFLSQTTTTIRRANLFLRLSIRYVGSLATLL